MRSTKSAWISWLSALALLAAGCSGGSNGDGGGFYVETCSLGCTNGVGGTQVSCGVVNTSENQELALLFSSSVKLTSVNKQSFQIFDVNTGQVPSGSFLIDPLNPHRLIFRPKLSFDINGSPIFGFTKGASYQVRLSGTAQGDPPPYVESGSGRENQARVLCTITTTGIVDPIPGPPQVRLFVDEVDPVSGLVSEVEVFQGQTPGAINVSSTSTIRYVFDELMNIGTLVVPSTGLSPFLSVQLDTDGDPSTITDRAPIDGLFNYVIDEATQTTLVVFTPATGFPSAGANPLKPRLVVCETPSGITDIAGNGLANAGSYDFAPEVIFYPPEQLPPGGEQFTSTTNEDQPRTGAGWGSVVGGQLTPGEGGGSGRLGDLRVKAGQTKVLSTGPVHATGTAKFAANPVDGDTFEFAGTIFTFKADPNSATEVTAQAFTAYSVSTLRDVLTAYAAANPTSGVAEGTFVQTAYDTLLITAVTSGTAPNSLTLSISPPSLATLSDATLKNGSDGELFSAPETITNFDFSAGSGTPGGTPPDVLVDDGVFEFSTVDIEPNASLVLVGDAPARLLVRGDLRLQNLGVIDVSGRDAGPHQSDTPYGQPGGAPGPNGGIGGDGGDRADNTANPSLLTVPGDKAVTLADSILDGVPGLGVGASPGKGPGRGGVHYPDIYPTASLGGIAAFEDLTTNDISAQFPCASQQVGGSGGGGAYATDGGNSTNQSPFPNSEQPSILPNVPVAFTAGGTTAQVGLEDPTGPLSQRLLTPFLGYLRGGGGGGGGGSHLFDTLTTPGFAAPVCFDATFSVLNDFRDHSAGGGGGGGGGLQVQVGRTARIDGVIDAGGGDGGTKDLLTSAQSAISPAPGGGGSGGAVLLQAGTVAVAAQPARIVIKGGVGGLGAGDSTGGDGGTGLARVEQRGAAPSATAIAASIDPIDLSSPVSINWLSVGEWIFDPLTTTPEEAFSAAQSCWMRGTGSYFSLTYLGDPPSAAPSAMGWNMDLILDMGSGPITVPYRGKDGNGPFAGLYPEEHWGQLLNSELQPGEVPAPIVVRFQGAKSKANIPDLCDVELNDPQGPVTIGSVTPWVRSPEELNAFNPLSDMVRWVIVFDSGHPDFGMIEGVTNLRIEVQPE